MFLFFGLVVGLLLVVDFEEWWVFCDLVFCCLDFFFIVVSVEIFLLLKDCLVGNGEVFMVVVLIFSILVIFDGVVLVFCDCFIMEFLFDFDLRILRFNDVDDVGGVVFWGIGELVLLLLDLIYDVNFFLI